MKNKIEETLEEEIFRFFTDEQGAFVRDAMEVSIYLTSDRYTNAKKCEYPQIKAVLDRESANRDTR